ncbi:MAG: hypothetical protein HOK90_00005, partial [Gemmatimonadetes bacterium]|nr:hypothetical protein [Gemmatimonadota bacterium]
MSTNSIPANPSAHLELNLKERLRRLNEIGVALSVEHDLYALLERILAEAGALT